MADRPRGPFGLHLTMDSSDEGATFRGPTSMRGTSGFHLLPGGLQLRSEFLKCTPGEFLQRLKDEYEFKVLKHKVGVVNASGIPFKDVADYVAQRNGFFGSVWEYQDFAEESDGELRDSNHVYRLGKVVTLRSRLDKTFQGSHMDEAVKYFYRWVRKAYKREFGADTDVPAFIYRGRSDELDKALTGVSFKDARYGGFNPRPIKAKIKKGTYYKLGTLSDHASGLAIDIEPDDNPQISIRAWAFIEKFTGKTSTAHWRETQWVNAPGRLWQYVNDLSDAFVKTLATKEKLLMDEEKSQQQAKEKKPGAGDKAGMVRPPSASLPARSLAAKPDPERFKRKLLGDHYEELGKYVDGFLTLDKVLVEALRGHGLTWGATFGSHSAIDLMHFELRKTPLPQWPPRPKK